MIIRRSTQSVAKRSGLPAVDFRFLPEVPATPERPPYYVVPPPASKRPPSSIRISPLWFPVIALLGIILGPGDTPRPAITDVPLPNEPPTSPADIEKFRQEYLAEMDRLRRKLSNGNLDEGEASFIRARIGVLTMLVGALPHTPENPFPNTRPLIVNSADGVPNSPDGADDQGNVAGPKDNSAPWTQKSWENEYRRRLKNPDVRKKWDAWDSLERLNPQAARAITEADLGPSKPFVFDHSGRRHVLTGSAEVEISFKIINFLTPYYGFEPWKDAAVDLRTVHPSHSLPEFFPYTATSDACGWPSPHSYRTDYVRRLEDLLAIMDSDDPQQVLRAFVKESLWDISNQDILILQLPSGKQIIWNGTHHIAALLQVVREKGLDPDLWLSKVPVKLFVIRDGLIPEALILRAAPAHELTIDDLLPPPQ